MKTLPRVKACIVLLAVVSCLAAAQSVTLSPASLSFSGQVVNTTSTAKQLTLNNGQTAPLTIGTMVTGGSFAVKSTTCPVSPSTLGAGSSCTISVTFTPTAVGSASGTLTVNDDAASTPQVASLSGTGLVPVSLTPTTLNFGSQSVGGTSASKTLTLKNNQSSAVTIASIGASGDYVIQTNTCPLTPSTLGGAKSCTLSVVFSPTATGTRTGTLTVTDNASNSPQTSGLTGTGTAPVTVAPTSVSFGNLGIGGTSTARTVTLTNGQTTSLTISSVVPTGDYQIQTNNCPLSPATLGAGASCPVLVVFKPTSAGVRSGKLTFNDDAINTPQSVTLTGTGLTIASIAVTPAGPSVAKGTSQQFTATASYSDGSTQNLSNSVPWTSSNTTVATISNAGGSQGLASGSAQGTSTISARYGVTSGSTVLTVTPATLVSIAVTPAVPSIPLGTTQQFAATGTFTDNSTQNISQTVQWGSSAPTVVTISNASGTQGLANSVGTGASTISATSGATSGSTTLTVTAALVSLTVSPANSSIAAGTTEQLTATGNFTDGSTRDLSSAVSWSSSNGNVATVSATGLATAIGSGSTTITASSGTATGSTTLTVGPATLVSIAVTPANTSIQTGTNQQFTATGTFTDGSTQDLTVSVYWTSSSATIATISDSAPTIGLATSIGPGTTTITAASGSTTGSTALTVTSSVLQTISIAPSAPSIPLGNTQQFTATGTFSDGSSQDITASVTWSSGSAVVAIISNSPGIQGLATSAGVGTTTVTATSGSLAASTTLTVGSPQLISLAVTPVNPSVIQGSPQQFTATGTFTDLSTQDLTAAVSWSSSNPAVATVNGTGLATTLGMGSTIITAASGSISGSTNLVAIAPSPVLTSITVTPVSLTMGVGATQQFAATGNYSDGSTQNLTNLVTWTSSSAAVATIQNGAQPGLATAAATGSTTITATYGALSGSAALSVSSTQLFIATALMDMPQPGGNCLTYESFQGGLYENCSNSAPADHDAVGRAVAAQIQPLDANGNPSPNGKFVLTSLGMSSAQQEFAAFLASASRSPSVNQITQALSNGAASNMDACDWFPAYGPPICNPSLQNNYDRIASSLASRGLTPAQVQVAWIKNANGRVHAEQRGCFPAGTLCVPLCDPTVSGCSNTPDITDALNLEQELGNTVRAAKQRWPNLKLVFLTTRIWGGYALPSGGNPEPFAYESGFAVKWLIQAQINQARGLGIDPVAGDLSDSVAPWIGWGPYFWADGPFPRSDGLVWCDGTLSPDPPCNGQVDFQSDGEHPKATTKQVNLLMNFFLTSPYTQPWFAAH